jgi:hypothetical protein
MWNALYIRNIDSYTKQLSNLAAAVSKTKTVQMSGTAVPFA